ncbi:MAG: hypothetical protein Q8R40_02905 [bacterium]|nr:hypothetical protein [bacterium]
MPNRSTIDRIAAREILERVVGRPLTTRFMNQEIMLSDADLKALADAGTFSIGVGKSRTYRDREINGRKFGSETAIMIYELRQSNLIPATDPVLDEFAKMMDRNNKDGYLVHQPNSVNWDIRQGYRLSVDPTEIGFTFDHEEVVRRAGRVIRAFINASEMAGKRDKETLERAKNALALKLLPEGNARIHCGPMTVSRYIRDMFVLGFTEHEMLDNARWFVDIHNRAKARQQLAKQLVDAQEREGAIKFDTFPLGLHDERGTQVDSDDPYLTEELVGRRHLVAIQSSKGNVIIMSKKTFDLSGVGKALSDAEPGKWMYLPGSQNIVANGTEGVEVTPTGLSKATIQKFIGLKVVPKK